MGVLDLPASTPKVVQKISEERKRKEEHNIWYVLQDFFSDTEIYEQRIAPLVTIIVHYRQVLQKKVVIFSM